MFEENNAVPRTITVIDGIVIRRVVEKRNVFCVPRLPVSAVGTQFGGIFLLWLKGLFCAVWAGGLSVRSEI